MAQPFASGRGTWLAQIDWLHVLRVTAAEACPCCWHSFVCVFFVTRHHVGVSGAGNGYTAVGRVIC